MDFNFNTISEFNDYFKDEKTCYELLESQRWQGVAVCPHCATAKAPYKVKARGKFTDIPSYRCSERACGLPFTVRTGSIYEGSKVELRKWFQALYEINISKKGISSVELATRIGVTQKTAWFINHRLRAMLVDTNPELLTGNVEVDETYIGGRESNKHKSKRILEKGAGLTNKTPMVGLLQREGKVILKVIGSNEANAATLKPIVKQHVSRSATLHTDGHGGYAGLNMFFREHEVVNHHQGEYVRGNAHTNSIEGFWSILKRGIVGTFHVVSPQHLQRYCDEFAYRYNNRLAPIADKFEASIKQVHTARLKYRELTPNNPDPIRKARYAKLKATN